MTDTPLHDFSLEVRAYIEDTDAGGIVYHANYLNFMERARTECLRELGFGKRAIFDSAHIFVVHSLTLDYKKPAVLDDVLTVEACIMKCKRTSLLFRQNIYRGEDLLTESMVKVACVNKQTLKPDAMDASMQQALQSAIALRR